MQEKNIQLWTSNRLRSDLARLVSVSESIAVDLSSGQRLEFNRAGVRPNDDGAKLVYEGPRAQVALVAVGNTIVLGGLTMAGTKMDEAGLRAWNGVRYRLHGHFHKASAMTGSIDDETMARLADSDPDVLAKKKFLSENKSFSEMLRDSRYENRYG